MFTLQTDTDLCLPDDPGFVIEKEKGDEEERIDAFLDEKMTLDSHETKVNVTTASPKNRKVSIKESSSRSEKIQKNYKCKHCSKVLATKRTLKRHVKLHGVTGQENLCYICGKQFIYSESVNQHLDSFHFGVRYSCDQCEKVYMTKGGLRVHKLEHTGHFKFTCSYCKRGFSYKSDFEAHIAGHEGVKRYSCEKCGKLFVQKSNLRRHAIGCGTISKAFLCVLCNKQFKEKRYLNEHVKIVHENAITHQCSTCREVFKHRSALYKHKLKNTHE